MQQYHNVSVRLSEQDYKQLLFLHDKYNRMSYGKVSLADVLRIAVKELYILESTDQTKPVTKGNKPVETETEQEVKEEEQQQEEEQEPQQEKPKKK
jgi:hypothetical protein